MALEQTEYASLLRNRLSTRKLLNRLFCQSTDPAEHRDHTKSGSG